MEYPTNQVDKTSDTHHRPLGTSLILANYYAFTSDTPESAVLVQQLSTFLIH